MKSRKLYLIISVIALVSMVLIVAGIVLGQSGSAVSAVPQSTVTIHARDMRFDLNTITAKAGQPITITLVNNDNMAHAFAIDALNVYTDTVAPNQSASVTFTPQQAGSYQFRCPTFRHDKLGMVGKFEVVS
ncbi:MAG: cupredoxin domain-containing protein [Chloroflexota bacterium]